MHSQQQIITTSSAASGGTSSSTARRAPQPLTDEQRRARQNQYTGLCFRVDVFGIFACSDQKTSNNGKCCVLCERELGCVCPSETNGRTKLKGKCNICQRPTSDTKAQRDQFAAKKNALEKEYKKPKTRQQQQRRPVSFAPIEFLKQRQHNNWGLCFQTQTITNITGYVGLCARCDMDDDSKCNLCRRRRGCPCSEMDRKVGKDGICLGCGLPTAHTAEEATNFAHFDKNNKNNTPSTSAPSQKKQPQPQQQKNQPHVNPLAPRRELIRRQMEDVGLCFRIDTLRERQPLSRIKMQLRNLVVKHVSEPSSLAPSSTLLRT